jgi:hypothetical protein
MENPTQEQTQYRRRRFSREACLRPEFAELYPGLRAGEWIPAAVIADRVLADSLLHGTDTAIRGRVLRESHFVFRGGSARGGEREGIRAAP